MEFVSRNDYQVRDKFIITNRLKDYKNSFIWQDHMVAIHALLLWFQFQEFYGSPC
jgi:hypothetical protein